MVAASCTTISFLPQAIKVIKTRHTKDISLGMYAILNAGVLLWIIYGFSIGDLPIIGSNVITIAFTMTILIMKLKYK